MRRRFLLSIALAAALARPLYGSDSQAEVERAVGEFLTAFNHLDWERFRACFADEASVIFPSPRYGLRRADGRGQFETAFGVVFEAVSSGKEGPPYQNLQPKDMRVQMLQGAAIVSFHLDGDPGRLGRRSLILEKRPEGWKIVHLHASNLDTEPAPR